MCHLTCRSTDNAILQTLRASRPPSYVLVGSQAGLVKTIASLPDAIADYAFTSNWKAGAGAA